MKNSVSAGLNKTGLQSNPLMSPKMLDERDKDFLPLAHADEDTHANLTFKEIKQMYIRSADAVGTVPLPLTLKGMATTGVQKITGRSPEVLIDKLGERMAFERGGTRLYDALIAKCEVALPTESLEFLREIRDEEAQHFLLVKNAIKEMGGDPTAMTPCADSAGVATMGIAQVINDPRMSVAQSAQAILTAELTDKEGWDLLIKLVEEAGMDEVAQEFRIAKTHEDRHVTTIRTWLEKLILSNEAVTLQ